MDNSKVQANVAEPYSEPIHGETYQNDVDYSEKNQPLGLSQDSEDANHSQSLNEKGTTSEPDYEAQVFTTETPFASTAKSFGVRKTELMTQQYQGSWLKACYYFFVFICAYVYALDGTLRYTFQVYATSSYSEHSLYTTVNVIRAVIAAASQPTYARLSDFFGRLELFIVSIVLYVVGTVIMSQAFDVQRFAGGAVLYQLGYSGVQLILEVSLADMSTLNWRLFASFIPALPFIINTWVSGNIAEDLLNAHSWSYCIGIWAFIFPLASLPVLVVFFHMRIKAGKTEEWRLICEQEKAERQGKNRFVELFWKIDVIGVLLIICVFGFILVPFTLAGDKTASLVRSSAAWSHAHIIAPLVVGICLIPALVFWEGWVAKFPIIPFPLLKDRGVWAALIIACLVNFIWYMPNDFMYTVLVVGMNTSIKAATRITSLYSFVSVIVGPILGLVLVKVKRTKGFILFGCAMWFVSMGIIYHFRGSNDGVEDQKFKNGLIGGLCLMGFGAGFFTYVTQLSIQTCTNHEYMAVVISLYLASYNIGSALGVAVSGAIWTSFMPSTIAQKMEGLGVDISEATLAYESPFTFIVDYAWGTPERIALALAYADIQRKMCIAGLCLCALLLFVAFFLRDHYLANVQSLDEVTRHDEGVHGDKDAIANMVVVNNYDDDPIARFFKGVFKRHTQTS